MKLSHDYSTNPNKQNNIEKNEYLEKKKKIMSSGS